HEPGAGRGAARARRGYVQRTHPSGRGGGVTVAGFWPAFGRKSWPDMAASGRRACGAESGHKRTESLARLEDSRILRAAQPAKRGHVAAVRISPPPPSISKTYQIGSRSGSRFSWCTPAARGSVVEAMRAS